MNIQKADEPIVAKEHILNHWNEYHIEGIKTKDDMVWLLNVLQAHGENLDTFHDAAFNGLREFCGIVGSFTTDDDTFRALQEFNVFYKTKDELMEIMTENAEDDEVTVEEYMDGEHFVETDDGIVHILYY